MRRRSARPHRRFPNSLSGANLRAVIFLALAAWSLTASPALACADYESAPSSRWSLARLRGAAWLMTPCGERFYSLGVNVLDGGYPEREAGDKIYYAWKSFSPSLEGWAATTRARLDKWGFNSAGGWSLPPPALRLPTVINLELGRRAKFHWFDPFAPETESRMRVLARELVAPYRHSPYRIGYFSDNEVGWWSGALFVFFSMKPAESATKQRWVEALRRHYAEDWSRFAADFAPPEGVGSWEQLLATTGMTHLKPGGRGIRAVREWAGLVAGHYYALAQSALREADPEALFLGDRLPIYYDPVAIRAMAPHVDAISMNYNVDSSDGWIAPYFFDGLHRLSGGKPVLITEWFFAARENRTGNRNNGHLMTVDTQAERARGAAAATRNFAALPDIVGTQWFQYYDHPRGGRGDGEDYDFGLVDIDDRPYERVTESLARANRDAPAIHARAKAGDEAPTAGPVGIPRAAISLADKSLSDWPKPAGLLPPLRAPAGDVAFGEAYLSWSEQGLALATIGQDYFDIDLLAYQGAFPLTEAYRLELGVDAGAGARRFTLFFIPPRTKEHDHPPMSAVLCAGAARQAIEQGCAPVPGAVATYFGADQPRITAEMLIPWKALGIAPPASGTRLKAEVAMTSWDRDRWISLSGKPPEAALDDIRNWREMRLGEGNVQRSTSAAGRDGSG